MKNKSNRLGQMIRAFDSRNYRLFFIGQGISLIGSWITRIATIWVVYQLTKSPLLLGIVGFASQIPSLLVTPFAGIIVDRCNRHRLLIITQVLSMIQSLVLAVLALTGVVNICHIIVLSIFQGLVNAFDIPGRQTFVLEMVEKKENLGNAIALNSSVFNSARLIGPAIAGLLIAAVGAGACFLIDGLSYIAVIISLLMMKIKPKKEGATSTANSWQRLQEGFVYGFGFPPIRAILMLLALVSLMGMTYVTLVPIFATQILQGGSDTLGFLMSASGIGALVSGIYLSSRESVLGLGKIIALSPAILGIALIGFALSSTLWLSLLMMFAIGFASILQIASSNTILQTIVDDDKRGRIMSLYTMAFMGTLPFGNLFAGVLAEKIGAPYTLVIGGVFCILGSLIFYQNLPNLRKLIRPIYTKIGILP